jgi:chromosome segregation ATPase
MKLPNDGVMIYSILEKKTAEYVDYDDVFLFYDKPQGLDEAEKFKLTHIESEEIRFSKRELDGYLASLANTSQNDTPAQNDSELLAKVEQLQAENDDLNARLSTARNTYKQHQNEIKELKSQLEKANADSAELKEQLSNKVDAPADDSILQTILDESREDHAPDLKHAIQLWVDLYIHGGIKSDSHSSKANIWIRTNTNYAENANSSIGRIREIATPLKDFGAKRSREEEN